MISKLKEIKKISIHLKLNSEKLNTVALFPPFSLHSPLSEKNKSMHFREYRHADCLSLFERITLKIHGFLFKYFPSFIPTERVTSEAKFKTVLALLLIQEKICDFFLAEASRRQRFLNALTKAAHAYGYLEFSVKGLESETLKRMCHTLTCLPGQKNSLMENRKELNLQIKALNQYEKNEILYRILNCLERPKITSVLEITSLGATCYIPLTTQYAKYNILKYNFENHKVNYEYAENHATSSVLTQNNMIPDAKGTINQRFAFSEIDKSWIGSYCGELSTPLRVLEQILLISQQTYGEVDILDRAPSGISILEKKIMFTSLYSWNEFSLMTNQKAAIQHWNQKIFKIHNTYYRLILHYYNISFSAWNKYWEPGEIKANIADINDETCIHLCAEAFLQIGLKSEELTHLSHQLYEIQARSSLHTKNKLLNIIDQFRLLKGQLIEQLKEMKSTPLIESTKTFLSKKKSNGKGLRGIDHLLYLDCFCAQLGYIHNKNCLNATDRTAIVAALDKAQYAFKKIHQACFLPGLNDLREKKLFETLYGMYLIWGESELNTWLSTDLLGSRF